MNLEYQVMIDSGKKVKGGFVMKTPEDEVLKGKLAKPDGFKLLADVGEYRGTPYLHLAEVRGDGKVGLYWLTLFRECRHAAESVYIGHFNVENFPTFSDSLFRNVFMDSPRLNNGQALVYLTRIDSN